jgi:peptide/nickel transport system permease protein
MQGDLGRSYRSNARVTDEVGGRFPATVELAVASMLIAVIIGLTMGTLAALRPHSGFDYSSSLGALLGVSIPTFWLGLILIIVFGLWLRWLPISGRINPRLGADPSAPFLAFGSLLTGNWPIAKDALLHLVLPAVTLAGWPAAIVARMTRASLIEAMGQEYIRTARAKGLRDRIIIRRHAAHNAIIPVLTVVGLEFGTLLGGAVVTETVFAWPGVGQLTVASLAARDYQVVQGIVLLLATVFVALNLLVDLLYAVADPRIRYG